MIELGGGASLAIGMALSEASLRQRSEQTARASDQTERQNAAPERNPENVSAIGAIARSVTLNERSARPAHERVLSALSANAGVLSGSQGALGASFGWSKTRMNEVLHQLQVAGRVRLSTGRQGTVVQLVGSSAHLVAKAA